VGDFVHIGKSLVQTDVKEDIMLIEPNIITTVIFLNVVFVIGVLILYAIATGTKNPPPIKTVRETHDWMEPHPITGVNVKRSRTEQFQERI
jgi:hypothetical protein